MHDGTKHPPIGCVSVKRGNYYLSDPAAEAALSVHLAAGLHDWLGIAQLPQAAVAPARCRDLRCHDNAHCSFVVEYLMIITLIGARSFAAFAFPNSIPTYFFSPIH